MVETQRGKKYRPKEELIIKSKEGSGIKARKKVVKGKEREVIIKCKEGNGQ